MLQRAKWALDEDELKTLKDRAEYFGLDKTDNFNDFKVKYLDATKDEGYNNKNLKPQAITGRNIVGEFTPREGFDNLIDDVVDYQGYNGNPVIIDSVDDFNQYVANDHFLAERTIRADDKETLDKYIDRLLCKNGENYFHVNCSAGGAQYGQGMYCAADYEKGSKGLSIFQHEIEQYGKMNGAGYYKTEWLTLSDDAKILTLPYNKDAEEYISDLYQENYIRKYSTADSKAIDEFFYLRRNSGKYSDDEYRQKIENLSEIIGPDMIKQSQASTMYVPNGKKYAKPKDPGVLAAEMGYDAVNAEGHGTTGSYTVVLNRTKTIFYGGDKHV